MGALRAFNPAFAYGKVNHVWVQQLAALPPFASIPRINDDLNAELPAYLAACKGTQLEHSDPKAFTAGVLAWWSSNCNKFPTWALAARIALSLTPNSASCERVFSLLACMFPSLRASSLADQSSGGICLVALQPQ